MLLKRNLFELVTVVACSGTLICVLIHYLTSLSPFSGIWFPLYTSCVFSFSIFFSFKLIQWLIRLNKPVTVQCDLERLIGRYRYLSGLKEYLPKLRSLKDEREDDIKEYDTNELSVISTVLEKRLVSSWYVPYISQEIGFPFACKQMLDLMISKTFQICNKIETKDVFVDLCSIIISHLKEYKKAVRRQQKCPESSIRSLYKMSHSNSNEKEDESAEHCIKIIRIILKDLVTWELWETPHSELLVRILSKKLSDFIDETVADPLWINDKLLTLLKVEKETETQVVTVVAQVNVKEQILNKPTDNPASVTCDPEATIASALSKVITNSTAPILLNAEVESCDEVELNTTVAGEAEISDLDEIKSSPVLRQRRGRQGRSEVKIYDRVIEGSVKTWETDLDLQCCSLGQDLLASLDGEITLSRLWGHDADADQHNQMWFGEEETMDMEMNQSSKETSPVKKELSPKPAELLKDLQSTVHQAKTKIGDLQVTKTNIDVPRKRSDDEAAGMMEGLLDFGIAGLKKGLRMTGLSDDSDKSPSHQTKDKPEHSPTCDTVKNKPLQEAKGLVANAAALQKEDNGTSSIHPLVKQHRVTSQDSVPSQPLRIVPGVPLPGDAAPGTAAPDVVNAGSESPDLQYEEVADLSTSIARLRTLLQQRADDHSPASMGDIWWEGAEETRGRTTLNTRHIDPASLADEYDMSGDRNSSPNQTSNNMQRLDKLFQRTVTGVFNSIKTAVGAEGGEGDEPVTSQFRRDWTYVCTSSELGACGAVGRLVGARRAREAVEPALPALHSAPPPPTTTHDATDDFEECIWYLHPRWSALADVLVSADLIQAHVTYRLATLLLADLAESIIASWLDDLSKWLKEQIFVIFSQMSDGESSVNVKVDVEKKELRAVNIDETVSAIICRAPELRFIFGEDTLTKSVRLATSSFLHKEINKDVTFRIMDTFALHFNKSACLRNHSFDSI